MCERQEDVQRRRNVQTVTGEVHTACITNLAPPKALRVASVLSPIGAPSCWAVNFNAPSSIISLHNRQLHTANTFTAPRCPYTPPPPCRKHTPSPTTR
jgi:hypothetical protein